MMIAETTSPPTPPNPVSPETIRRYVGTEGIVGPAHAAKIAVEAFNNKELPLAQFFAKIAKDFSFAKALSAVDGDTDSISWKDLSKLAAGKAFIAKADVGTVPELNQDTLSDLTALAKLIPIPEEQTNSEPYKLLSSNSTAYVQPQPSQQPEPVYYRQSAQSVSSPPPQIIYLQPIQSPCYPQSSQVGYPQPKPSVYPPMPYPAYPQPYGQDPYATANSGGYGACPPPYPMPYSGPYSAPCPPPPPPVQPTPQPPIFQTNNTYNTYNTTHNTFNNQVYNNQTYTTNNNQRFNMPMNFNQLNNSGLMAFNNQTMNQYNRNTFPPMPYRGAMPGMMPGRPPMYGNARMSPV